MIPEIKRDLSQEQNQSKETNGYKDPRFERPVMGINLTADSVSEEYQQYLNEGGDKAEG